MTTFKKADILIPQNVDLTKWSVVACDQYTSEPEYWHEVENFVGDAPSTLNITFPEVYLAEGDARIQNINSTMHKYLRDGIFKKYPQSLIYIERTTDGKKVRKGIVGAVDLEDYDFKKGSDSKIRATEGTVLERIPPRVKIRENAPLELPHVMLLIDDKEGLVIEKLAAQKNSMEKLYDFDLMQNGGHLTGYLVPDGIAEQTLAELGKLEESADAAGTFTYAVGDGNHSLATAKTCWENLKKTLSPEERKTHPARFALCELENIHDNALFFEPIHRVVFGANPDALLEGMKKFYKTSQTDNGGQCIEYITKSGTGKIYVDNPKSRLTVGTLQTFLDEYMKTHSNVTTDYIHGEDVCRELGKKDGNIGFVLPAMEKSELFPSVAQDGALPRKTFSMGEAYEKRFYMEAKMIVV